jgi:hypothetical protein
VPKRELRRGRRRLVRPPRRERDPRACELRSDGVALEQPGSPGDRPGGRLGVGEVRERIDLDDRDLVAAAAEIEERVRDAPVELRRQRDDQRLGREDPAGDEARVAPAMRSAELALEEGVRDPVLLAQARAGDDPVDVASEAEDPDAVARVSDAAAEYGRQHGITVIDGGCPLMFGPTADVGHKLVRVVLSGRVPKQV